MISTIFYFPDSLTLENYVSMVQAGEISPKTIVFAAEQKSIYKGGRLFGRMLYEDLKSELEKIFNLDDSSIIKRYIQNLINRNTYDDTNIRESISRLSGVISDVSNLADSEKNRLDLTINSLSTRIQSTIEGLFTNSTWVLNNMPRLEITWNRGWNENILEYLSTVGYWDSDGETWTTKYSLVKQGLNSLSATVTSMQQTAYDGSTVTEAISSAINQAVEDGIGELDLRTTYAKIADLGQTQKVIEWMYSGLRNSTSQDRTFALLYSAGESGLKNAISEVRTYVNKLKNGDYVAESSMESKVNDAVTGLYNKATANSASTNIFSKIKEQISDLDGQLTATNTALAGLQTDVTNLNNRYEATAALVTLINGTMSGFITSLQLLDKIASATASVLTTSDLNDASSALVTKIVNTANDQINSAELVTQATFNNSLTFAAIKAIVEGGDSKDPTSKIELKADYIEFDTDLISALGASIVASSVNVADTNGKIVSKLNPDGSIEFMGGSVIMPKVTNGRYTGSQIGGEYLGGIELHPGPGAQPTANFNSPIYNLLISRIDLREYAVRTSKDITLYNVQLGGESGTISAGTPIYNIGTNNAFICEVDPDPRKDLTFDSNSLNLYKRRYPGISVGFGTTAPTFPRDENGLITGKSYTTIERRDSNNNVISNNDYFGITFAPHHVGNGGRAIADGGTLLTNGTMGWVGITHDYAGNWEDTSNYVGRFSTNLRFIAECGLDILNPTYEWKRESCSPIRIHNKNNNPQNTITEVTKYRDSNGNINYVAVLSGLVVYNGTDRSAAYRILGYNNPGYLPMFKVVRDATDEELANLKNIDIFALVSVDLIGSQDVEATYFNAEDFMEIISDRVDSSDARGQVYFNEISYNTLIGEISGTMGGGNNEVNSPQLCVFNFKNCKWLVFVVPDKDLSTDSYNDLLYLYNYEKSCNLSPWNNYTKKDMIDTIEYISWLKLTNSSIFGAQTILYAGLNNSDYGQLLKFEIIRRTGSVSASDFVNRVSNITAKVNGSSTVYKLDAVLSGNTVKLVNASNHNLIFFELYNYGTSLITEGELELKASKTTFSFSYYSLSPVDMSNAKITSAKFNFEGLFK